MGNDIKLIGGKVGNFINQYDTPQHETQHGVPMNKERNIEDCRQLNVLLSKHVINLGCKLQLQPQSISKNGGRWDRSLVRGTIYVEKQHLKNEVKKEQGLNQPKKLEVLVQNQMKAESDQKSEKVLQENKETQQKISSQIKQNGEKKAHRQSHKIKTYNIILTLQEIYELKRLLSSYTQQEAQQEQKRKTVEGQLCVICLDSKPEEVLPCAHEYCKKCVQTYIINKDRKCPMCRKSYKQGLASDTYQIVEWDSDFVEEMRNVFYKVLEKNNIRQVQKIRKIIEANQKQNHN